MIVTRQGAYFGCISTAVKNIKDTRRMLFKYRWLPRSLEKVFNAISLLAVNSGINNDAFLLSVERLT